MKLFLTIILAILLFCCAVILGLKNQQLVDVNYLIVESEIPLATLMAIVFTLGLMVATLISSFFYFKLRIRNRLLRREVEKLRTIPAPEKD